MRIRQRLTFATGALAIGAFIGILTAPPVRAQVGCEENVCNTEDGDCTTTDIRANCEEISGSPGCKTTFSCPPPVMD